MENKNNTVVHITAVTGWLLIMGYFLKLHFSVYSLCLLLIAGGYLVYTEILIKSKQTTGDKKEKRLLTDSLDRMIGVTSVTLLGYYILTFWPFEFIEWNGKAYGDVSAAFFMGLVNIFRKGNLVLLLVIIGVFILGIIKINPAKNKVLNALYQYLAAGAVFFYFFYSWTNCVRIGLLYIAITIIFFGGDVIQRKNRPAEKIKRNKWYVRFSLLLFIFLLLEEPAVLFMSKEGYLEYYILVKGFSLINIIFISAVFMLSGTICWIYEEEKEAVEDWFLYLVMESALLVCYTAYIFYVGYWWLILAVYIIISSAFILRIKNWRKADVSKGNKFYFLLFPFSAIFILYEAHNGKMISSLLMLAGIILLYKLNKKLKKGNKKWMNTAWLSTLAVLFMGVAAAGRIFEARHLYSNYLTLFITGIFFILLIWYSCYNPDLYAQNLETIRCGIIICMFAVLCTGICFKSGNNIKVVNKSKNEVAVTVKSRGKENSIKKIEGYWLDDYTDAILIRGEKKLPKVVKLGEIPDKYTTAISKSGRLRIVAEDKHGIKTTGIRWYRICRYTEGKNK